MDGNVFRMGGHVVGDTQMVQHNTLGFASGTRGVNKVTQVLRREIRFRVVLIFFGEQFIHTNCLGQVNGNVIVIGDDVTGITIPDDLLYPFFRVIRVHGYEGTAGLDNTQHGGHQAAVTL
ncbi:hypothetical protein DSECCO2_238670 [anaerobic digester metagenome]